MKKILNNKWLQRLVIALHFVAIIAMVYDFGFVKSAAITHLIIEIYIAVITVGLIYKVLKHIYREAAFTFAVLAFDLASVLFIVFCIYKQFTIGGFEHITYWLRGAVFLRLVRAFSNPRINTGRRSVLNPAQLFILSFLGLIFGGALLLMLPNATYEGINFIDALFTATSAVCVTGLIVVDTSTFFTVFGQYIIMCLIQIGGLGILTFASYFSYFFKGGSTYENQIALSQMTNSERIGDVFSTVKKILLITFLVEAFGAFMIYISLDATIIPSFYDRIYFSVFHAVSAFCNAGFSTLSGNMMEAGYVYNYQLQFVIICIFVFGGLGFPIVINSVKYIRHLIGRLFFKLYENRNVYQHWILTLSNRINLVTTFILTLVGTAIVFFREYDNVLSEHSFFGKIITAIFTATTPRTAGFNSVDFSQLHFSTTIIILFLMWIGASPASTGGGIKTSTFAVATLNYLSLARGKARIEVFRREIADITVKRAFAVMSLSLLVISLGILLIAHFDKDKTLLDIAFECFSAYSTAGLSLGITGSLSTHSKLILVVIMFIGRVSMLTILIAIFKKVNQSNYSYPTEEILIN